MIKIHNISDLGGLPDAQIVENKVNNGERGAYLIAFGPLAQQLIDRGGSEGEIVLVVRWLPRGYIDEVETILDAEGYSVSRA